MARQTDIKMTVGDFVSYFNNPMRQRVLNLISLEFSDTKLVIFISLINLVTSGDSDRYTHGYNCRLKIFMILPRR